MGKSESHVRAGGSAPRARAFVCSALVGLVLALAFPVGAAAAVFASPLAVAPAPREAGRVIVRYRSTETLEAARADAADAGAQVVGRVRTFGLKTKGRYVVVSSDTVSTSDLMRKYSADPAVKYVEPDYMVKVDGAITPDDPLFGSLWGLSQVSAPLAWGTSTGQADVVVADIDTGVDYAHPDLAANMWHNPGEVVGNGIDDDGNGYIDDVYGIDAASGSSDPMDANGHGTHTSGTIAAVGDNGIGVTGVNWTARIMALKFMDSSGSGYTSDAVTCLNYMTWEKVHGGVNVVAANNSWGSGYSSQTLRDAIATAGDAGIVVVCAAGNGGDDDVGDDNDSVPHYPSSFDCANIISVAATDSSDRLASFSNWGATSVDLAAPGVGILSAVPTFVDVSGYQSWNGTSMATPHVTGAVALMAAAYRTESMATRISMIENSVDPVAGLVDKVAVGGRLNVANALYRGAPVMITGFSPASGSEGTSVTVAGTGFTGATAVRFNGSDAAAFTAASSTQITATVPAGATTGPIAVTTPYGTAASAASFTVVSPDTTAPTTVAKGADSLWHNAPVTVTLTPTDNAGGSGMTGGLAKTEYKLDDASWTTGISVTVAAPASHANDGSHTLNYRSTDAAGNVEATKTCTVNIDTSTPLGSFSLAGDAAATTTITVSGGSSVSDAHGPLQMRFSLDGRASWTDWEAYAASRSLTLPGGLGSKTVYAQYRDAAGNVLELSDAIELAAPTDAVAPTIQASGASEGAWYRFAATIMLSGSDVGSGVATITYRLDGIEMSVPSALATLSVPALPNAAHVLTYHATDAAGNSCADQTLTFTIDTSGPVTAAKATSGRRGRAIALRYKVADNLSPKATATRIVVRNRRGTAVKTIRPMARNTATWYSAKWTPKARGTYRYYVYAKDLAGNAQSKMGSAKVVVR